MLDPEKIVVQLAATPSNKSAITFCWGIVQPKSDFLAPSYARKLSDNEDSVLYVLGGVLPTTAPLHKKKMLVDVGGFNEALPCAQERDLHLRLVCSGVSLKQVAKYLFTVRRRPGSVSCDSIRVLKQHLSIVEESLKILETRGELTAGRQKAIARLLAGDARQLYRAGQKSEAMDFFRRAADIHQEGSLDVYGAVSKGLVRVFGPVLVERLTSLRRATWKN